MKEEKESHSFRIERKAFIKLKIYCARENKKLGDVLEELIKNGLSEQQKQN